jgi:localization factor PodJL
MRPGVPWNVKGIEAEAREVAQQAARRAGVSLGEWLSGLILTDGKGGQAGGYPQSHTQQGFLPGDGTFGPQPQFQPQPQQLSQAQRYPQAVPQVVPQGYQQPQYGQPQFGNAPQQLYPQPSQQPQPQPQTFGPQQGAPQPFGPQAYAQPQYAPQPQGPQGFGPQQGGPQAYPQQGPGPQPYAQQQPPQHLFRDPSGVGYEQPVRSQDIVALAGTVRELGERFEQSDKRAQQAVATVNQSVAAMQERIDAAERVKQLADAAFTSAADTLAQSAREQSKAFDSLETTVRSVQKRIVDIETGQADWPGRDSIAKLETALGHLHKRLGELDAERLEHPGREAIGRIEATLGQLQKRLTDMETAAGNAPGKDALARLESSVASMRGEVVDADRRTREDITQMAKYMRDLGSRVDTVERGSTMSESITARFDALEARSSSMFDEIRGQMSAMDGRIAQAASAKNAIPPAAFAALKGSVEGIAARIDGMGEQSTQPLVNSISSLEAKLGALTTKIDQNDKRTAESVGGVNAALTSLSARIEDSDKRQSQSINGLSRRMDESDGRVEATVRDLHKSFDDFSDRLEVADQHHKDSMSALRLTVDGLVARGVADAVPQDPNAGRLSNSPSALSSLQGFAPPPVQSPRYASEPELPPFPASSIPNTQGRAFGPDAPPPFDEGARQAQSDGLSLEALRTILATPQSSQGPDFDDKRFEPPSFGDELNDAFDSEDTADKPGNDFLAQARRAAQAAAERQAEHSQRGKRQPSLRAEQPGGRNLGRLVIIALAGIAVVAGIVAVLFTLPGGSEDGVERPDPGSSIGEILNGPTAPAVAPGEADGRSNPSTPPAEFAPLPPASETGAANGAPVSMTEPMGGSDNPAEPAAAEFTAGTSALPGTSEKEAMVASLESGAVRGDAKSQFLLSLRYSEGRGVVKDDARAASLAAKAAEQGLAIAQYRLGALYERGVGVEKSMPLAKSWYEKAAKLGNRKAMHNLAVLLADSSGGQPNYKEAARWFKESATHGLTDSQYNLAVLLEQGMGIEKNLKEAITWYAVAASQGDNGAAERLDALKKAVGASEVALALDAARRFKPKPLNPASNDLPAGPG